VQKGEETAETGILSKVSREENQVLPHEGDFNGGRRRTLLNQFIKKALGKKNGDLQIFFEGGKR